MDCVGGLLCIVRLAIDKPTAERIGKVIAFSHNGVSIEPVIRICCFLDKEAYVSEGPNIVICRSKPRSALDSDVTLASMTWFFFAMLNMSDSVWSCASEMPMHWLGPEG